jgi:hypothetical protein
MGGLLWLHSLVPHGLSDAYRMSRLELPSRRGVLGPSGRVAGMTKRTAEAKSLEQVIQDSSAMRTRPAPGKKAGRWL